MNGLEVDSNQIFDVRRRPQHRILSVRYFGQQISGDRCERYDGSCSFNAMIQPLSPDIKHV